jgi:hypothetical protein
VVAVRKQLNEAQGLVSVCVQQPMHKMRWQLL